MCPKRRAMLGEKGRALYGKYCGTGGRGICAESFSVYHIGIGEIVVAQHLVCFLEGVLVELQKHDPNNRLESTQGLLISIQNHIKYATCSTDSLDVLPISSPALRDYVKQGSNNTTSCSCNTDSAIQSSTTV